MISSVSANSYATQQAGYFPGQPLAPINGQEQDSTHDASSKPVDASKPSDNKQTGELSEDDLKVISELQKIDAEVRAHEAAHLAAAGGIAVSGASFEFQQGPDGNQYAIGGEVSIDTSPVPGDPAATLRKADTIRRAALAPAQPSGPDMQAAAGAVAMAAQAQIELLQKNQNSQNGNNDQLGTKIDISA